MHAIHFFEFAAIIAGAMLIGTGFCHLVGKIGGRFSDALCRAPGLDVLIVYFTVAPLIVGPIIGGWAGFFAAVAGQIVGMQIWQAIHELIHRDAVNGPRIVKVLNAKVGAFRNYSAVWLTATVTPLFFIVRMAEILVYPPITWLVRLPKYNQGDWVNVSRQKFCGLVGHDLIWCLYCDWMTGVWSLGTEMLRNVESFWCPIRFASGKKCVNCAIDFPDVNNGWVDANGTMADVARKLDEMYTANGDHPWFGHPVRLTVKGKSPEPMKPILV